ncbi:MAG: ABC transporter ATP-binding protein [Microbacteriaceae bacterium]
MRKLDLAVRVTGLAKSYDSTRAVDTISFDVPRGTIYGVVGPNGAGKTTTLMMMAGLVRPDTGRITINDSDVWTNPDEAKSLLGVMPDRFLLFDRLTGWQMLYYAGILRGMKHDAVILRSQELVRLFGLETSAARLIQDYSAGMVKKLSLACALIHSPEVLVLDEPFESVDPVSTAALIRVLRELTIQGVTVILSSHDMNIVSKTCDFLAIIIGGRVLDQGEIADVLQGRTLEERFRELVGIQAAIEEL